MDGFFVSYYAIKCQYALNALFEIYTDVRKNLNETLSIR